MAEENFAAVTMKEWAAVYRHVKDVEEDHMSRQHEMDSVKERIIINADKDDDDTSESSDVTTMELVHSSVIASNTGNN